MYQLTDTRVYQRYKKIEDSDRFTSFYNPRITLAGGNFLNFTEKCPADCKRKGCRGGESLKSFGADESRPIVSYGAPPACRVGYSLPCEKVVASCLHLPRRADRRQVRFRRNLSRPSRGEASPEAVLKTEPITTRYETYFLLFTMPASCCRAACSRLVRRQRRCRILRWRNPLFQRPGRCRATPGKPFDRSGQCSHGHCFRI